MSYILEALKKAEAERGAGRPAAAVLAPPPGVAPEARHRGWPIAGGLVVVATMGAAVLLFTLPSRHQPPPARLTGQPELRVAPPPPASVSAVESRPAAAPSPRETPEVAPPPRPLPPAPMAADAGAPHATAARPASPHLLERERRPPTAPPQVVTSTAPARQRPPVPETATDATSPTVESSGARAAERSVAPEPAAPPRPPATASLPSAAPRPGAATTPAPAPTRAPNAPKLKLEVLFYSDVAEQRMVFINGRKYREGDAIDGSLRVEQITEEGAVIARDGTRFLLKE
jgi:general secretion pathway protein B